MNEVQHHRPSAGRRTVVVAGIALAVLATCLSAPPASAATARADHQAESCTAGDAAALLQWNAVSSDAIGTDAALVAPLMGVGMAYVQAAVYNAVVGIDGSYELYRWDRTGPPGASIDAAIAAAARGVLLAYFPEATARVEAAYAEALAAISDGHAKTAGIRYGERAAAHLVDQRADDGWKGTRTWDRPEAPGIWRPTPPSFIPFLAPWLSNMTPFLLRSSRQFRPGPPPTLTSDQYTRDFLEVTELGSATSATRTPEQTEIARFFGGNLTTQLHGAYRDHLTRHCTPVAAAARYLAVASLSVADSVFAGWDAKYHYGNWRPVTAIQLADTDGNPETLSDPDWTPLLGTPAHPDYVSGHCISIGTVTRALRLLDGTRHLDLDLYSTVTGTTRHFEVGSTLKAEGIGARVWGGIHTRTADEVGTDVGRQIGKWWATRFFGERAP